MGLIYEDERYFSANDVNRFDAEKFDRFIDCLAHDMDRYTADAKILENGYGKYYHNTTYVGKAASASKEFIDRKQFGKFHVESKEVQKELFYKCTDVRDMFREQVDSSPKARIDSETLGLIKRDYRDYYDELEHEGYDIECMAREIENHYGKYGREVTQPNYRRSMEVYDELCCHGGFMDKCIRKFENFNEDARQHMKRSMIKEHSYDLQKDIKATASALEGMTVFKTEVERQAVWLNTLGVKNAVVDTEKLVADIQDIVKLSGLKHNKNELIDANMIKKATDLALLNCKNSDEKFVVQKCSNSMMAAAVGGPITWKIFYDLVMGAIEAIGASMPWAIAITVFVLILALVLKSSSAQSKSTDKETESQAKTGSGSQAIASGNSGGDDEDKDDDDRDAPKNKKGEPYPEVKDPRTGENMKFPEGDLERVPPEERVDWYRNQAEANANRTNDEEILCKKDFIDEWYRRGYETPEGGWDKYEIHHIKPREFGGENAFENLIPVLKEVHRKIITPWWMSY